MIWTTGALTKRAKKYNFPKANIVALRGRLIQNQFEKKPNCVLGDGGLLCSEVRPIPTHKIYDLGIIPHYVDKQNSLVKKAANFKSVKVIDICGHSENIINTAARCKHIISSSLHGLILADSLGVPNKRFLLSPAIARTNWKFDDYYSNFGLNGKELVDLKTSKNTSDIIDRIGDYERKNIDDIKQKLMTTVEHLESIL